MTKAREILDGFFKNENFDAFKYDILKARNRDYVCVKVIDKVWLTMYKDGRIRITDFNGEEKTKVYEERNTKEGYNDFFANIWRAYGWIPYLPFVKNEAKEYARKHYKEIF